MERYLIEFIGSLFFIYIVLATKNPWAIGAALAMSTYILRDEMKHMFNPVVTIVMAASGKLLPNEVAPYIISQIAGGLAALEVYKRVKF